jgi:hypothetical protein
MMIKTRDGEYINLDLVRSCSFRRASDKSLCTMMYEYANGDTGSATIHKLDRERFEISLLKLRRLPRPDGGQSAVQLAIVAPVPIGRSVRIPRRLEG